MRFISSPCVFSVLLVGGTPGVLLADSIAGDRIVVDATNPAAVTVEHVLTWSASTEAGPRTELVFHLARGVEVVGAEADGVTLSAKSSRVADSWLDRWTVTLDRPLGATKTREITLRTTVETGDSPGVRVDASGGVLAPGSGWMPAPAVESDELLPHQIVFRLPDGMVGVAAGTGSGGTWGTQGAVRPFAAWGAWKRTEFRQGNVDWVAYRRAVDAQGDVPGAEKLGDLLGSLEAGLGPAVGDGPWTFVDVGRGFLSGGVRTILWDEDVAASGGLLHSRDIAAALSASFWSESMRFTGPQAALLSRAFLFYLGDVATISLDPSDQRWRMQARVIGPRRDEFARNRSNDRALHGLLSSDPAADRILRTRGALVAHMTDQASRGGAYFIEFLREFRSSHSGARVDDTVFQAEMSRTFGNRAQHLSPYRETTDLPDFVLGGSERVATKIGGERLKVQVTNLGSVKDVARVSTFSASGIEMLHNELLLEPGQTRSVLFGNPERIARVEVDASRRSLQQAYTDELLTLEVANPKEEVRPSFSFHRHQHDMVWVTGLDLSLDGVSIRGFEGHVAWYETHHGPSGLLLMGNASVTVSPPPPHTESFREAMNVDRVEIETPAIWVRFPLGAWKQIEAVLEAAGAREEEQPTERQERFMFDHSFPTGFAEGLQAQVPPPGGALAVISLGGVERRAFLRDPKADGTVYARYWDQLRGVTLWEDTR